MLSTWVIVDMLLLAQTECVFNLCDHVEWNNPIKKKFIFNVMTMYLLNGCPLIYYNISINIDLGWNYPQHYNVHASQRKGR